MLEMSSIEKDLNVEVWDTREWSFKVLGWLEYQCKFNL